MKHPSGRSIVWCVAGILAGTALHAATAQPQPDLNQPLFGVVRPAPETIYRDKPVYRMPDSCIREGAAAEQYEIAASAFSGQMGDLSDILNEMHMALNGKDVTTYVKLREKYQAYEDHMYDVSNLTRYIPYVEQM